MQRRKHRHRRACLHARDFLHSHRNICQHEHFHRTLNTCHGQFFTHLSHTEGGACLLLNDSCTIGNEKTIIPGWKRGICPSKSAHECDETSVKKKAQNECLNGARNRATDNLKQVATCAERILRRTVFEPTSLRFVLLRCGSRDYHSTISNPRGRLNKLMSKSDVVSYAYTAVDTFSDQVYCSRGWSCAQRDYENLQNL